MALKQVTAGEWESEVLQHDGVVLVDFYADWCGPCRWLAPLLEKFAGENAERVKVVKVDSDADEALSEQYMVKKIPTLIAFKGGQELRRAINPQSRGELERLIAEG